MPEESENMDDGIEDPLDDGSNESSKDISIKKAFDDLLKEHLTNGFNEKEMRDVVAKLIASEKLNTMVIDLYDYETGFFISFHKFGEDVEITHGVYSYGVPVLDYIKDGEIPYELFDVIYNYDFQLFYDGYIACELRIHINGKEGVLSNLLENEDVSSNFDEKESILSNLDEKEGVASNLDEKVGVPSNFHEQRSVLSYSDEQDVEPLCSDEQDVEPPCSDQQEVEPTYLDEQEAEPSYFDLKEGKRLHYVLLKHSIQTIDGECCMKVKKDKRLVNGKISSVEYDKERARLIHHYSPDLCLDPDPVVAEILTSNGLKQHSFITPHLKRVIQNEKEQIEWMLKASANKPESVPTKVEDDKNWNFRAKEPTEEEVILSEVGSDIQGNKLEISSNLKVRKMYFPDMDSFTRSFVEIENFVYEYEGITIEGEQANILDKVLISVIDDKEHYYVAYQLDERMRNNAPSMHWWEIGDRESLDMFMVAVTKEEKKMTCDGALKITHNRIFDEKVEFSDETVELREGEFVHERKIKITRQKLAVPISEVMHEDA